MPQLILRAVMWRVRSCPRKFLIGPYHTLRLEVLLLSRLGAAADRLLLIAILYSGAPEPPELERLDTPMHFVE